MVPYPLHIADSCKAKFSRSRPLHFAWDKADPNVHGYCFDEDKFFKGSGSVNVFLNFIIFALVSRSRGLSGRIHLLIYYVANPTPMASPHNLQATNGPHSDLHARRLVRAKRPQQIHNHKLTETQRRPRQHHLDRRIIQPSTVRRHL